MRLTLIDAMAIFTVGQIVFGGLFLPPEPTMQTCPDGTMAVQCSKPTATVLKNLYKSSPIGPNPLFSSCFIEAGFVPLRRAEPEPSSPQADTVELTAFAFAMF